MLDVGGASALLVVTEFFLGLLLTSAISFASRLRAQRILYTTGYLDLSEIAWTSRRSLDPRVLYTRPRIFLFNIARFLGPCVVLILFAFIGSSLTEVADVENFEPLRTKVHSANSYWDTLGAVWNVVPIIDRGLSKGEWRGTPSRNFVPINNTEFARLEWADKNSSEYQCTNVLEEKDEYAITIVQKGVHLNVGYLSKTVGLITEESRVRKVGDVDSSREWFSTPYHSNFLNTPDRNLSQDEAEDKYSSLEVTTKDWREYASGAAYRLKYSLLPVPAQDYASPDFENFQNKTWALDGFEYVTLLNKVLNSDTERTPEDNSNCSFFSAADVIVDFVGVSNGRRAMVDCRDHNRIDVTRGMGIRQRFVCRRKQKRKKGFCNMVPISTSTLAAGIAAKLGVLRIYGVTSPARDGGVPSTSKANRFAEKLTAKDVGEAMQLGLQVLTAGAAANETTQEILVAKKSASLNWMLYAISTATVIAIVCVALGAEFLARLKFRKLRLHVEAPLDPLQMAHACGSDGQGANTDRRRETPLRSLGIGARLQNANDRGVNCFIDIGSRDTRKKGPAWLDYVELGENK